MLIGFQAVIDYIKKNKLDSIGKDVYEFGVCTGGGTGQILESFTEHNIKFDRFYGFDSFEGLPKETEGLYCPDIWHEGAFTSAQHLHMAPENVLPHLNQYVKQYTDRPVEFIKGFYEDTLNDDLMKRHDFKEPLFISMDVDIHKSCIQVWEFMIKLVVPGTIIRYDDWGDFTNPMWEGQAEGTFGESLAHKQIVEKYGIEFEDIFLESGVKIVAVK